MSYTKRSYNGFSWDLGIKWYRFLVPQADKTPSLLEDQNLTSKSFIISEELSTGRRFSFFSNTLEYKQWLCKNGLHKCETPFFEVCQDGCQRIHFDLDIKGKTLEYAEKVKDNLVSCIVTFFEKTKQQFTLEKDIALCTSHGEGKHSYHIVLPNRRQEDSEDGKYFHSIITSMMKEEHRQYVDSAVYSPKQQWRLVGNYKLNSNRMKQFYYVWAYQGKMVKYDCEFYKDWGLRMFVEFEHTLISTISGTNPIKYDDFKPSPKKIIKLCISTLKKEIEEQDAEKILQDFSEAFDYDDDDFSILKIEGQIISLKRNRPTYCCICERNHEHENPFLVVRPHGKAQYFCRRSDKEKRFEEFTTLSFDFESNNPELEEKIDSLNAVVYETKTKNVAQHLLYLQQKTPCSMERTETKQVRKKPIVYRHIVPIDGL